MLTSFGIFGICIRDKLLKLLQDNIFIEWEIILDNVLLYMINMINQEIRWAEKSLVYKLTFSWFVLKGKCNNSVEM